LQFIKIKINLKTPLAIDEFKKVIAGNENAKNKLSFSMRRINQETVCFKCSSNTNSKDKYKKHGTELS
jgi:hypothetical protein